MPTEKVAITLDERLVEALDGLVKRRVFASRSQAVQIAVKEKIERMGRSRLAEECAKLDPKAEQEMAEEGFTEVADEWPEY